MCLLSEFFCFKQKTAYEMRISDWSSDVCSSDLKRRETLPDVTNVGTPRLLRDICRARATAPEHQKLAGPDTIQRCQRHAHRTEYGCEARAAGIERGHQKILPALFRQIERQDRRSVHLT